MCSDNLARILVWRLHFLFLWNNGARKSDAAQQTLNRDRRGGGAGRAIALPLFCWDLFSRAPVDMEKVLVELLDFSLKGGRLEPVFFDEFLRTMQFLWKSGMFACPNDYNPMCV